VIAVGTTVVRALESPGDEGWTRHVVTRETGVGVVDGILTGWHEPAATHLDLLEALAGPDLVARSYREALATGYRWHEWGDVHLLLRRG
jgi:S-adenosylmethionine:tRNA ribosyltransferase-isomerase